MNRKPMNKKRIWTWVALVSLLVVVFTTTQSIAKEKTVILNVPACSS
jgi:hypothetical protein